MAARQIYSDEISKIREIHNAIDPSRTRKARKAQKAKAPVKQKLMGVGMLLFSIIAPFILNGDATISVFTLPMSLMLILSKEKVIM